MGACGKKILVLLWKNLLLRKCHFLMTGMEIILPSIYIILAMLMNIAVQSHMDGKSDGYRRGFGRSPPQSQHEEDAFSGLIGLTGKVAYAPQTQFANAIISAMRALNQGAQLMPYNSEGEIEELIKRGNSQGNLPRIALIFGEGFNGDPTQAPPTNLNLEYKIRVVMDDRSNAVTATGSVFPDPIATSRPSYPQEAYKNSKFAALQLWVDKAIIKEVTGTQNYPQDLYTFGFPGIITTDEESSSKYFFIAYPIFVGLGYIVLLPAVLIETVGEKETGVKELTRMMGLPNWMHLVGWVVNFILTSLLSVSIIVLFLFLKSGNAVLIETGSPGMFWASLFLYCMQTVAICLLLAAIFDRVLYPLTAAILVSIISLFGAAAIATYFYRKINLWLKLLVCVLPNGALVMSTKVLEKLSTRAEVSFFEDLFRPARIHLGDDLSVGLILTMMLATTILCLLLSLYLESVLPSAYGVRKPFYYIFQKETWLSGSSPSLPSDSHPSVEDMTKEDNFEEEPSEVDIGIEIKKLRKVFSGNKVAVNDVSLNIFKGQITVLLGHNGAGKTTLMSMLTGLTSPTSGTAIVNGFNISTNLTGARNTLGLCPQHNMLFNKLTVKQHLTFFAMLKGASCSAVEPEINYLLQRVNLIDKKDVKSSKLSGGQKRKLNLCMSLVGGSKTVILDEPTSGMDPEARRGVWDLLSETRSYRTILLTTHHMEEADVLGDRIAIMNQGKLKCCGSPHFLKRRYGTGYVLHANLLSPTPGAGILSAVQKHAPDAALKHSQNPQEVAVSLSALVDSSLLPKLFASIEGRMAELNIASLGLTFATMDDIFVSVVTEGHDETFTATAPPTPSGQSMDRLISTELATSDENVKKPSTAKVTPARDLEPEASLPTSQNNINTVTDQGAIMSDDEVTTAADGPKQKLTGISLVFSQFLAILLKRIWYTWRKKTLLLFQIVLPLLLLIWVIWGCNKTEFFELASPPPPLTISLDSYQSPVVLFDATPTKSDLAKAYASVVGSAAKQVGPGEAKDMLDRVQAERLLVFRNSYVVAASFTAAKTYSMFSAIPLHTFPLAINLMNNAWLKLALPNRNVRIQVTNHPLSTEIPAAQRSLTAVDSTTAWVLFPLFMFAPVFVIGLALSTATFTNFPVEERVTKVKQVQLMTGVSPLVFWSASFLVDFCLVLLISLLLIACLPIFQIYTAYTAYNAAGVLLLILLSFGFASISFSYAVSLFVASPTRGFAFVASTNIFYGFLLVITFVIVQYVASSALYFGKINFVAYMVPFLGRIVPFYGLLYMCSMFATTVLYNSRCMGFSDSDMKMLCDNQTAVNSALKACCYIIEPDVPTEITQMCFPEPFPYFQPESYLKWWANTKKQEFPESNCNYRPGILQEVFFEFLIGLLYLTIVLCVDFNLVRRIKSLFRKNSETTTAMSLNAQRDTDVMEEDFRVQMMLQQGPMDDAIVLSNVRKMYGNFVAVSNLNFGVHRGECFGLLGVNGAGKTTTFNMITGAVVPSSGNAFMSPCAIANMHYEQSDLSESPHNFLKCIGYCPQEDPIIGVLTGMELLKLFCRLRGGAGAHEEATKWITKFGLAESGNVQSRNYSGGMKRRLCAAMAMIGDPPVVLLDEPTAGVDPVARRQLWGILKAVQESGQTIILTSHTMDECEALCSRLGIMVNGELQCFGGTGHIKGKYGQGFVFSIKLKTEASTPEAEAQRGELKGAVFQLFAPCQIVDEHQNMIHYHVYNMALSWAERFEISERLKHEFAEAIEDYTVTEANLEDVFLAFARMQYPERKADGGCCSCCG